MQKYNPQEIEKKWSRHKKGGISPAEAGSTTMNNKYNPAEIEFKWQSKWKNSGLYKTKDLADKSKFYALDFFPYPSGDGLHVGHTKGYTATDAVSRMKMMQGFNVLHPMGWDAFGLPAENYAIKNKIHPRISTGKNINTFRKQMHKIGFTYDWDREISTIDPEFYKWTQWIFLKMFEKGLAYESDEPVNWCPSCKTVLANEDLEGGVCERCGTQVVQKKMKQWVLKMTAYADRLLYDLDSKDLDWEELIKEQQRNWIGRSEGVEVEFPIVIASEPSADGKRGNPADGAKNSGLFAFGGSAVGMTSSAPRNDSSIKVYTTRLDTIYGCTYCVVAPEHKLIAELKEEIENYSEVEKYIIVAQNKTNLERSELQKEKTGVELEGIKAVNPFSGEEIPVWVADYVLGSYGTGAVMAVPAHDERDFEFAKKYNLPIKQSVAPYKLDEKNPPRKGYENTVRKVVHMILENTKGEVLTLNLKGEEWGENKPKTLIIGGIEEGEKPEDTVVREIKEETGYTDIEIMKVHPIEFHAEFFAAHKKVNRYVKTTGVICRLKSEKKESVAKKEQDLHDFVWVKREDLPVSVTIPDDNFLVKVYINNIDSYIDSGILINSEKYNGLTSAKAREEMTKWLEEKRIGQKKVNYKMRDWVFSRQRYWGEPIPLIFCKECKKKVENEKLKVKNEKVKKEFSLGEILNPGWIAVDEKDLPVRLPDIESYEPTGTGESPLAKISEWVNVKCPKCGGLARRETTTMPQWAGSSWYYLAYIMRGISNFSASGGSAEGGQFPLNQSSQNSDVTGQAFSKYKEEFDKWLPVDLYVGGAEHATRHLLYARFWHKFLFDIGAVSTVEPFKKLFHVGLILAEDGRKMSKRWGNVINPDDVVREFGADSFRLYEMFMGPFSQSVSWSAKGVVGMRRFLERVWQINAKQQMLNAKLNSNLETEDSKLKRLLHKTIKKVGEDIEEFKFNTAISALMILTNEMSAYGGSAEGGEKTISKEYFEKFLILLSPFVPHIAEEIWSIIGNKESIFLFRWPEYDINLIKEEEIEMLIQVNGKLRDKIKAATDISEDEAKKLALSSEKIQKEIAGKEIKKIVFVKNRLVNIVI